MMDFITIPVTTGICIYGFYKVIELIARRKERITIAEKFGPSELPNQNQVSSIENTFSRNLFPALRFGSLLVGLGLGLLIGFLIVQFNFTPEYLEALKGTNTYNTVRDSIGIVYGASTLLFGGIGLICGFIIEWKLRKQ